MKMISRALPKSANQIKASNKRQGGHSGSEIAKRSAKVGSVLGLSCSMLLLAACGSTPVDEALYDRVEAEVTEAREIDAQEYASEELYLAEKKLKEARMAEESGNSDKADRLLKEAQLHAELAQTSALAGKDARSLKEINAGLRALDNELRK